MSIKVEPVVENTGEQVDIQGRNKRFVQIDAVGVGTANAASPFLPVFLTRLGASPVQIGLLTSMPGVTGLFLALWVGRFLQRQKNVVPWFSLSRLLVISAFALTGLVPFFVPDNVLIVVILLIWALATLPQTMVAVGFSVVMNAVSGPDGRYDLMSRRWSILGITTAIAVALAGQVLVRIGFHLNYQLVFLGLSMGGLVSYYFSSRIQIPDSEPVPAQPKGSVVASARGYYSLVNQEPAFVSFTLKRFVYLFGIALGTPLFPLYFVRELDASDAWIGLLYTVQTVILVVGYYFWSRQSRKSGSRFVLLVTTLILSFYPALIALTKNQVVVFVIFGVAGIFQAGIDLVFFDELMKTIPPRYAPTFVSLAQSITYLSSIFAPLLGTYLSEQISLSGALMVSAGIRLIGFLLFFRSKPIKVNFSSPTPSEVSVKDLDE